MTALSLMPSERQRALAWVALLYEPDQASELFALFPKERETLLQMGDEWRIQPPELRKTQLLHKLKKRRAPLATTIASMHPEWIAASVAHETPRIAQTLIGLFPTALAKRIAESVPPFTGDSTARHHRPPKRAVDPELLALLQERFGREWESPLLPGSPLATLVPLSLEQWTRVFTEVARDELAVAFSGLKRTAYTTILHRLPLEDAKAIGERLRVLGTEVVDKKEQQRARVHLVSLDMDKMEAAKLALCLGFYLFSKALWKERDIALGQHVAHRFPISEGRQLLDFLHHHRYLNTQRSVMSYQKRFLETYARLYGQKNKS